MRAHSVPFYLVALDLTAPVAALVTLYAYHNLTLVADILLLLLILALSLRAIALIDSLRRRPKS